MLLLDSCLQIWPNESCSETYIELGSFFVINPNKCTNFTNLFCHETLRVFRTVRLSIIRSLFTAHSAMVYVIQVCRQFSSRSICSCSTAVYKLIWHIPLLSVQWINSWWWTDALSETCRVSWQNKFVNLVQLFGFITKNVVTMHGHMNVDLEMGR